MGQFANFSTRKQVSLRKAKPCSHRVLLYKLEPGLLLSICPVCVLNSDSIQVQLTSGGGYLIRIGIWIKSVYTDSS